MSITAMKQARKSLSDLSNAFDEQEAAYQTAEQAIYALDQAIEKAEKQKHAEQLAEKGWQYFECPACGSEGAKAFPKPVQEPFAYLDPGLGAIYWAREYPSGPPPGFEPIYTAPPAAQRQWVGLTDEEICAEALKKDQQGIGFIKGAEWADAKLKEKNT